MQRLVEVAKTNNKTVKRSKWGSIINYINDLEQVQVIKSKYSYIYAPQQTLKKSSINWV